MISIAYGGNGSSPWSNMVINVSDSPNAPTPVWADSYGVCSGPPFILLTLIIAGIVICCGG